MLHTSLLVFSFGLLIWAFRLVTAQQQPFANFENRHMDEWHRIQISDEVAFFKIHDTNGDGFWDESELRAIYGFERDIDPSAKHVRTIVDRAFQDLDTNGDRLISLTEYMRSQLPDWTEEELREDKQWRAEHAEETVSQQTQQEKPPREWPHWQETDDDHIPDKFKASK